MSIDKWLFVCEGTRTEPDYLKALERRINRDKARVDFCVKGVAKPPRGVVNRAAAFVCAAAELSAAAIPFDRVFTVFDKDAFSASEFNDAAYISDKNGFVPLWSNESFELWLLLHFDYMDTAVTRENYLGILKSDFKESFGKKYSKSNAGNFDLLSGGGKTAKAVYNAKRLAAKYDESLSPAHKNPCTMFYRLFEIIEDELGVACSRL